ncbi:phosphomannomutase [Salmonella enterica]|nr:phosphomannomutase [Salmonella enterica]EBP7908745.1 phosphomannomutase [Salmonella enterica]EDR2625260.1 phosphomannomutase [Salmonella enterica subsp. enterica serovar Thompson]
MNNTKEIIKNSGISFGTSGARGLVKDFKPNVCAAFTYAFVDVMSTCYSFDEVALAIDNRPSSYAMAQACAAALLDCGIIPRYYGVIPTPALANQSIADRMPAIMVTGSHIPFDRNGIKFYRPDGEISKENEISMLEVAKEFSDISKLPDLNCSKRAAENYIKRNTSFLCGMFKGKRIGIYEHSSAGRDLYSEIFTQLGATVVTIGRSDEFIPIDTEAVSKEDEAKALKWVSEYNLDMLFSTDGDGDRPLVADENGFWLRGDILGLLCSKALGIEAVAVPVSCNTIIQTCGWFKNVALTKIGSPYVIAAFDNLNKNYKNVAGFEANGGYLVGSDIAYNDYVIKSLPTRDAVLPALMVLALAINRGVSISGLLKNLSGRVTYSNRIQNFATERSKHILQIALDDLQQFIKQLGFGSLCILSYNTIDGLRVTLSDDSIIHLRPSGNAPELRCYAEADNLVKAEEIVDRVLHEIVLLGQ